MRGPQRTKCNEQRRDEMVKDVGWFLLGKYNYSIMQHIGCANGTDHRSHLSFH
jgi:hypothetical protein